MATATAEDVEREQLETELKKASLEELRAKKAEREKQALNAQRAKEWSKTAGERVLVYAIRDAYFLGKKSARKKRTGAILSDGRPEFIPDEREPHQEYPFRRHRCWVFRGDLIKLRRSEFYGIEFKEALTDESYKYVAGTEPLEACADYPAGMSFIKRMADGDKQQFIRPPISETEVRLELKGLRAGKVKAPPLTPDEREYAAEFLGVQL